MPISLNYVVKRVVFSLLVIIGVITISYLLLILTPGDPAVKWAGNPRGPEALKAIEQARAELGLDKPIYIQVTNFIYNVLTGNIGESIAFKIPVSQVIYISFTATLELLLVSYVIAVPLGTWLGVYSALKRGTRLDGLIQSFSIVLTSTPTFWIGALVMIALYSTHGFIPYGRVSSRLVEITGFRPITGFYLIDALIQGNTLVFIDALIRVIPPALAISIYPIGLLTRVTRTLVAETLLEDYVRVAVAWGVKRNTILRKYVIRSVIPPLVQIIGLAFIYSLVDAMVVESIIYGREGLGKILIESIKMSDFRVTIALIVYLTLFYIVVNTIVDVIQALIDPRVKL